VLFVEVSALDQPTSRAEVHLHAAARAEGRTRSTSEGARQRRALGVSDSDTAVQLAQQKGLGATTSRDPERRAGNRTVALYTFGVSRVVFLDEPVRRALPTRRNTSGCIRARTIAPGSDADIVVWDPEEEADGLGETHHSNVSYNLFRGRR
jgi:hypothetical protein